MVPLAALTVAVTTVDEVEAMLVGLAEAVVVVLTGAVTVTATVPLDFAKLPVGV